jgi:hypothetical protein
MRWASKISLGSTQKAWEEVSRAVEPPVRQLQEQLPREAVLNVDETGWRTNGAKRWIWALVASRFVFFVVAPTRGAEVLVSLLGAVYRGILGSDRWVVYLTYHSGRMQLCWAHLKRNILGIADYARRPSAAVLPGRAGHCGSAMPPLASVLRRLEGSPRKSAPARPSSNRSRCKRSCSPWPKPIWTMRTARYATWPRHCSFIASGYTRLSKKRAWIRPIMSRNGPCALLCSGGRSASATAATTAKSPRPDYSPSLRPASGNNATSWVTSLKQSATSGFLSLGSRNYR